LCAPMVVILGTLFSSAWVSFACIKIKTRCKIHSETKRNVPEMSRCPPSSSPDCAGVCNGHSLLDCDGECYDPTIGLPPHIYDCAGECYLSSLPAPHFFNYHLQCVTNDTICPIPPPPSPRPRRRVDPVIICRRPIHLYVLLIFLIAMTILVFIREKNNKKL